jgi:transcriptional repressor NrdR
MTMRCPNCSEEDTRVLDSRPTEDDQAIRRRRECPACLHRFTTYERIEQGPLVVVKKDGRREVFDRQKVLKGVLTALQKRPIPLAQAEEMVAQVERQLRQGGGGEVLSAAIGERVMDSLRQIDQVAYIRFASVYRAFEHPGGFREMLEHLEGDAEREGRDL